VNIPWTRIVDPASRPQQFRRPVLETRKAECCAVANCDKHPGGLYEVILPCVTEGNAS
jgi:hypothetical protein